MLIRRIANRMKQWLEAFKSECRHGRVFLHCKIHRKIPVFWYSEETNLGDVLNAYLVEKITGRPAQLIKPWRYRHTNYFVIGSVLSLVNRNSIVWGAGLIHQDKLFQTPPREIRAVRGPLTRERLLEQGVPCPKVYGDPALLLPRFYDPDVTPTKPLGIIPHFSDKKHPWIEQMASHKDVVLIDIQTDDIEGFVQQVLACERIIASSLHGVILADAYRIPSLWIPLSADVGEFKFHDYFRSVGRDIAAARVSPTETDFETLKAAFFPYEITIDLDLLMSQCPLPLQR